MVSRMCKQVLALVLLAPLAFSVMAQPERYVAGTHYIALEQPVRTNDPSRVEVVEVFWYGCPGCFSFEPLIQDWKANAPDHVDFHLLPVAWDALTAVHAQAFYTAESLGVLDDVHTPIFEAINVKRNRLQNERQLAAVFAEHGVSEEKFSEAFKSFSVRTKVNQVNRKVSDYQVAATPSIVVNGKYTVSTNQAVPTHQEMLNVVNFLVEKERMAN